MIELKPKTFMGERRQGWSSEALCFDVSRYDAHHRLPDHGHRDAFFCLVVSGTTQEIAGRHRALLTAGSLVYHPSGFEHSGLWYERGHSLHIEFSEELSHNLGQRRSTSSDPRPLWGRANVIAREIYAELQSTDSLSPLALEGLALTLLAETFGESSREVSLPRWLRQVRERLNDEYMNVPSLAAIAIDSGVHPAYLANCFKHHFGMTVGEFVRLRRVDRARQLLANTEMTLSVVAFDLGFADQSHFHRTFKRQVGVTPLEYRRRRCQNSFAITKP